MRPLFRWDAGWYGGIVSEGYEYESDGKQHNIAFFPLYPLLTKAVSFLMPGDGERPIWLAQIAISNICFVVALACIFLFCRRLGPNSAAAWGLCFATFFPMSFFFSSGYPEALFLALVCPAGLALLSRRLTIAAVLIGVATSVRPTGVAFIPTLAVFAWKQHRLAGRTRSVVGLAILASSGGLLYLAYLAYRFGTPFVYFENFESWLDPNRLYAPLEMLYLKPCWDRMEDYVRLWRTLPLRPNQLLEPAWLTSLWVMGGLVISINGLIFDRTDLRWFYFIPLLLILIPYWSSRGTPPTFEAIPRYLASAYPMYVALGLWVDRGNWKPLAAMGLACMAVLLAYASYCFAHHSARFVA
jgi:hypothetical protein